MGSISITNARKYIYKLVENVATNNKPITITNNKGSNAVLISEDDWNAIEETLYLNSIPGFVDSINKIKQRPESEFLTEEEVEW